MKTVLLYLTLTATAAAQNPVDHALAACGARNVTFSTSTRPAPSQRASEDQGKALLVFIQDDGPSGNRQRVVTKIGVDGSWVGAYKRNSYFVVPVEPGLHHICATAWENVALAPIQAQSGKTYYIRTQFFAGMATQYPIFPNLVLDEPNPDEAGYLLAAYPLAEWHVQK